MKLLRSGRSLSWKSVQKGGFGIRSLCFRVHTHTRVILQTHWVDGDQQSIIRPGSQFHAAVLQVEREMEDDNLTVTLKDGRRVPRYHPVVLQQDFSFMDDGEVTVSAAEERRGEEE